MRSSVLYVLFKTGVKTTATVLNPTDIENLFDIPGLIENIDAYQVIRKGNVR